MYGTFILFVFCLSVCLFVCLYICLLFNFRGIGFLGGGEGDEALIELAVNKER